MSAKAKDRLCWNPKRPASSTSSADMLSYATHAKRLRIERAREQATPTDHVDPRQAHKQIDRRIASHHRRRKQGK